MEDKSERPNNYQFEIEFEIVCSMEKIPVKKSFLSIDDLALTVTSNKFGIICLNNLPSGSYVIDIIAVGFIASTFSIKVEEVGFQKIRVEMISNIK